MKSQGSLSGHRLVLVDCNFLVAWTSPVTSSDDRARLDYFLETATKDKQKIVIPTPVVAEYLVRADAAGVEWLDALERKSAVEVVPFDRTAAFETAQMDRAALGARDKKDGSQEPWQKIKIDRQIIAKCVLDKRKEPAMIRGDRPAFNFRVWFRDWLNAPSKAEARSTAEFWNKAEQERTDGRDVASILDAQLAAAWNSERKN